MEYIELFRRLFESKVEYLVCGGLAVNIYGIPRMTADIDILINFTPENVLRFESVVDDLSYASTIPITLSSLSDKDKRTEIVETKNLIAYSFYNTRSNFMNLDILIDVPISFEEMWEYREVRKIDDIEFYIVSLDHLIELKTYANRNQDKQDILMLSKLQDITN